MYRFFFKRMADIIGALFLIMCSFPIFILVSVLLLISIKNNPLFIQKRPGKGCKIFSVLKFKSMTDEVDKKGSLLSDELRITKLGAFLRKSSLDEIPQLFNVLKGDMSFIGPRPLLIRYLPYYTKEEQARHTIRPGITGLAQISGRNLLNWDDRLQKDIEYVKNISFTNDVKIIFKTIKKVLIAENVLTTPGTYLIDLDESRKK